MEKIAEMSDKETSGNAGGQGSGSGQTIPGTSPFGGQSGQGVLPGLGGSGGLPGLGGPGSGLPGLPEAGGSKRGVTKKIKSRRKKGKKK